LPLGQRRMRDLGEPGHAAERIAQVVRHMGAEVLQAPHGLLQVRGALRDQVPARLRGTQAGGNALEAGDVHGSPTATTAHGEPTLL